MVYIYCIDTWWNLSTSLELPGSCFNIGVHSPGAQHFLSSRDGIRGMFLCADRQLRLGSRFVSQWRDWHMLHSWPWKQFWSSMCNSCNWLLYIYVCVYTRIYIYIYVCCHLNEVRSHLSMFFWQSTKRNLIAIHNNCRYHLSSAKIVHFTFGEACFDNAGVEASHFGCCFGRRHGQRPRLDVQL